MSGWVFRQNDKMDTQMKNTDITPIIWNKQNTNKFNYLFIYTEVFASYR